MDDFIIELVCDLDWRVDLKNAVVSKLTELVVADREHSPLSCGLVST